MRRSRRTRVRQPVARALYRFGERVLRESERCEKLWRDWKRCGERVLPPRKPSMETVCSSTTPNKEGTKFRKSNYRKIAAAKGHCVSRFENSFADDDVTVDTSAFIQSGCVLGRNTKIGAKCVLRDAIIGQNCSIGSNVTITNCVLFDGCIVENDAKLTHALVGCNAKIGEKAIIHAGSVVGTSSSHRKKL